MKRKSAIILLSVVLIITMLACGLENIQIVESPNLEATITAQALVLQQGGQAPAVAPGAVNPPVANAVNPLAAGAVSPTATNTATANNANPAAAGQITVTVSAETNCRKGPGASYASVYSLPVGLAAEVVGKNTASNYWIIKMPGGSTCWLWGKYATISGDAFTLNEVGTPAPAQSASTAAFTITPTPTKKTSNAVASTFTATSTSTSIPATAPNAPPVPDTPVPLKSATPIPKPNQPTITDLSISCPGNGDGTATFTFNVSWSDNSDNEKGFGVKSPEGDSSYAANTTSHQGSFVWFTGSIFEVGVYAWNEAGNSPTYWISMTCPSHG
jgi:hypothetical protein